MKPTKIQHHKRVFEIYRKLLGGCSRPDILQFGSDKWGVSARTVDDYMAHAREWVEKALTKDRSERFAESVAKRQALLKSALVGGDIQLAHEIMMDTDRLLDLYPKSQRTNSQFISLAEFLSSSAPRDAN